MLNILVDCLHISGLYVFTNHCLLSIKLYQHEKKFICKKKQNGFTYDVIELAALILVILRN